MNTRPELERVVTDWLHADVTTAGSDEVLAGALVRVAVVRQERIPRPERFPVMNTYAKLAVAVAALAVVAVVGINLLPGSGSVVGGSSTVKPSSVPMPSGSPSQPISPSPSGGDVWPGGPLGVERHRATLFGIPVSFKMPTSGWTAYRGAGILETGDFPSTTYAWIVFGAGPDAEISTDPCQGRSAPVGPSLADRAASLTRIPGTDAVGPSDVTVGGRPAKLVALTIHQDVPCAHDKFWLYGDVSLYPNTLASQIKVWNVDVDGTVLQIHTDQAGPNPALQQQIQQIVDSIQFE